MGSVGVPEVKKLSISGPRSPLRSANTSGNHSAHGGRDIHGELVPLFGLSYVHIWPLQVLNHIARGWRETQNVPLAPLLAHCRSDRHGGAINALPRRF